MPRLPRIHLDGAIFLISCRGQDGEMIFKDKADKQMYLELVNRYKDQHHFRLYAYALLPERVHLLVEPGDDATISQIMHDLNSSYTKYFNGKYSRRGHLFESRFKSSLVEKTRHLLDATRHIHRQLPAEGIVSSFEMYVLTQDGKDAETPAPAMAAEIREALEFLKSRDERARYEKFCLDPQEDFAELDKLFKRSSVIGSPEFVERVQNRIKEYAEQRKEEAAAAPARPNRIVLLFFSGAVILATAASIYFYVSRQKMEAQYEALIRQMEVRVSGDLLSDSAPHTPPSEGSAS